MAKLRPALWLAAAIAGASPAAPGHAQTANAGSEDLPARYDTMAERTRACTGCHGEQGRAGPDGYQPRLAGKPARYLHQQLRHFAQRQRHYAPMERLIATLDDQFLAEIAEYFAALSVPYPAPLPSRQPREVLARGRSLAQEGDPARGLPACAQCHGTRLTGVLPDVPGLLGLPRDYLNAQLGAWRNGQRATHAPDCMAQVARRLSTEDLSAVTHWLSSQTVPADGRPIGASAHAAETPKVDPHLSCARPAPVEVRADAAADADPGLTLIRAGHCAACHSAPGGAPLAGGRAVHTPFGRVYSSNLTPDADTGLGPWNADDFFRALREGRSRDGRLLNPAFPYAHTSVIHRADSDAMFNWLHAQPSVRSTPRPHEIRWPLGTQAALAFWRTLYFRPRPFEPAPDRSAQWNRGAYLVLGAGQCAGCHAPRNALGANPGIESLSGGLIPGLNWYAPNLESERETGLSSTPIDEIVRLLRTGRNATAGLSGPMAEVMLQGLRHLSESDLRAMAVYLQSRARPARHGSEPAPPSLSRNASAPGSAQGGATESESRGRALYERHCAHCHGDRGEGVPGAYPALRGNRAVLLDDPSNLVQTVLHGGFTPSASQASRPFGMPPFLLELNDQDIAGVITYLRTALQGDSRRARGVSPREVVRIRERGSDAL